MKASVPYRVAAALLLLFAVGHTVGFRQTVPDWQGTGAVIASMKAVHFDAQGFDRTYWDFFSAFGLYFSVFLVLAAFVAWELGGRTEPSGSSRRIGWSLAFGFASITGLTWVFGFTTPLVFSASITACLIAGAILPPKRT